MARILTEGAKGLKAFLDEHHISLRAAGKALGVSHPGLLQWLEGEARPSPQYRQAIETWTGGRVMFDEWYQPDERQTVANVEPYEPPAENGSAA